jgi:hypothetical protein
MYQHEKTALLVDSGDWRALGLSVIKVLKSPSLASHLAIRAETLARQCEWAEVRKSLYRAYGFGGAAEADRENSCVHAGCAGGTGRWKQGS